MGYTVSVKFKTTEEKEKMEKFLSANENLLESMNTISEDGDHYYPGICNGDDLSYAPELTNLLGFDVSHTPSYIWNLCAWMAVKAECKNKNGDLFFYYDQDEMIVTFDSNNKKNTLVDTNGIRILNPNYDIDRHGGREKLSPELIKFYEEIAQNKKEVNDLFVELNDKWNEFNLQYENPSQPKKNKL
jgi:hypothetical protein